MLVAEIEILQNSIAFWDWSEEKLQFFETKILSALLSEPKDSDAVFLLSTALLEHDLEDTFMKARLCYYLVSSGHAFDGHTMLDVADGYLDDCADKVPEDQRQDIRDWEQKVALLKSGLEPDESEGKDEHQNLANSLGGVDYQHARDWRKREIQNNVDIRKNRLPMSKPSPAQRYAAVMESFHSGSEAMGMTEEKQAELEATRKTLAIIDEGRYSGTKVAGKASEATKTAGQKDSQVDQTQMLGALDEQEDEYDILVKEAGVANSEEEYAKLYAQHAIDMERIEREKREEHERREERGGA